jgi:lycopene beta-cyclase
MLSRQLTSVHSYICMRSHDRYLAGQQRVQCAPGQTAERRPRTLCSSSVQNVEITSSHNEEWFPDLTLNTISGDDTAVYDVLIAGAGPSGLAVASRVAKAGFRVAVIDPDPLGQWINNYGVWVDEFSAMGLDDCFDVVWPTATVHLNSSADGERTLRRPYARVDRPKLKRKLLEQCIEYGVEFYNDKVKTSEVMNDATVIVCNDGKRFKGTFAVDATGHSKALVKYDGKYDPGYQGAYGITINVESHPFDVDKMLFMDWRDDHLDNYPKLKESNAKYVFEN